MRNVSTMHAGRCPKCGARTMPIPGGRQGCMKCGGVSAFSEETLRYHLIPKCQGCGRSADDVTMVRSALRRLCPGCAESHERGQAGRRGPEPGPLSPFGAFEPPPGHEMNAAVRRGEFRAPRSAF